MKIRAGGEALGQEGSFRAAGCSPLLFLFVGNTINMKCLYMMHSKNTIHVCRMCHSMSKG